jgi:outer membrane protein OmpA-like peptidoglycan-associated protein
VQARAKPHTTTLLYSIAIVALVSLFAGCAAVNTFVVLLPEEGGAPAAVTVGEGSRATILDSPLSAAAVDTKGNIERRAVTAEDVNRTFADALAAQPPKAVSFTLYFETNSTEVAASSRASLDALLAEVAKRQAVEVQVTGHTDRVGSVADNDRLSLQRAEAVRSMLVQRGIQATFIRAVGRGEREPLVPTADEVAEARNRRVEVIVR